MKSIQDIKKNIRKFTFLVFHALVTFVVHMSSPLNPLFLLTTFYISFYIYPIIYFYHFYLSHHYIPEWFNNIININDYLYLLNPQKQSYNTDYLAPTPQYLISTAGMGNELTGSCGLS